MRNARLAPTIYLPRTADIVSTWTGDCAVEPEVNLSWCSPASVSRQPASICGE
jgi:hypothetical protein